MLSHPTSLSPLPLSLLLPLLLCSLPFCTPTTTLPSAVPTHQVSNRQRLGCTGAHVFQSIPPYRDCLKAQLNMLQSDTWTIPAPFPDPPLPSNLGPPVTTMSMAPPPWDPRYPDMRIFLNHAYNFTAPRCHFTVVFSSDPASASASGTPRRGPSSLFLPYTARAWLNGLARDISTDCVRNEHFTGGRRAQLHPGYPKVTATVQVRIFGDRKSPELVHWLTQRRKPGWMTDKQWTQELTVKWGEFINYGNESQWYP